MGSADSHYDKINAQRYKCKFCRKDVSGSHRRRVYHLIGNVSLVPIGEDEDQDPGHLGKEHSTGEGCQSCPGWFTDECGDPQRRPNFPNGVPHSLRAELKKKQDAVDAEAASLQNSRKTAAAVRFGGDFEALEQDRAKRGRTTDSCSQPGAVHALWHNQLKIQADYDFAAWVTGSGMSFNIASHTLAKVAAASISKWAAETGGTYKPPSHQMLASSLLDKVYEKEYVHGNLRTISNKISDLGFIFSTDGMTGGRGLPIYNFCLTSGGSEALTHVQHVMNAEKKDARFIHEALEDGFKATLEALVKTGLDRDMAERACMQLVTDGDAATKLAREAFCSLHPHVHGAWCSLHCESSLLQAPCPGPGGGAAAEPGGTDRWNRRELVHRRRAQDAVLRRHLLEGPRHREVLSGTHHHPREVRQGPRRPRGRAGEGPCPQLALRHQVWREMDPA